MLVVTDSWFVYSGIISELCLIDSIVCWVELDLHAKLSSATISLLSRFVPYKILKENQEVANLSCQMAKQRPLKKLFFMFYILLLYNYDYVANLLNFYWYLEFKSEVGFYRSLILFLLGFEVENFRLSSTFAYCFLV